MYPEATVYMHASWWDGSGCALCDDQCHSLTKKYHNYIAMWDVVYVVYIQLLCRITDGDDIS